MPVPHTRGSPHRFVVVRCLPIPCCCSRPWARRRRRRGRRVLGPTARPCPVSRSASAATRARYSQRDHRRRRALPAGEGGARQLRDRVLDRAVGRRRTKGGGDAPGGHGQRGRLPPPVRIRRGLGHRRCLDAARRRAQQRGHQDRGEAERAEPREPRGRAALRAQHRHPQAVHRDRTPSWRACFAPCSRRGACLPGRVLLSNFLAASTPRAGTW